MGASAVKPGPFAFAHLTDPHLPLAAGDAPLRLLLSKRITGYLSWTRNRQHIHRPEVLAALIADVRAHAPDHVAVTGDLANISTPGEMARARDWLASLGPAADVTVIPGNHDVYVRDARFGLWAANMQGDRGEGFPFVRRRGPVAFIGATTGVPTPFFMAHGALGAAQTERLDEILAQLGDEGVCRVVLLHHPPAGKAAAKRRKGLRDREAFARIVQARGAELILHGHIHHWTQSSLPGPHGQAPVLSAASASAAPVRHAEPANWNLIRVHGEPGAWRLTAEVRGLAPDGTFHTLRNLDPVA